MPEHEDCLRHPPPARQERPWENESIDTIGVWVAETISSWYAAHEDEFLLVMNPHRRVELAETWETVRFAFLDAEPGCNLRDRVLTLLWARGSLVL